MQELDLLILGAGWTSTFLIPIAHKRQLNFAATTQDGRKVAGVGTIKWSFDPTRDSDQFSDLPLAKNVVITFPLKGEGQSRLLVQGYEKLWNNKLSKDGVHFIQLGSTGVWQIEQSSHWTSRSSPYDESNSRAIAEDELISLGGCSLNLAGLWGGERQPWNWVSRVAKTKEDVKGKKSLHLINGVDVARAILAVAGKWAEAKGQRWMLTDGLVYDWWELFVGWAAVGDEEIDPEPRDQARWVYELMDEEGVKALPRSMETLGRCYDSREFWTTFGLTPRNARVGARH